MIVIIADIGCAITLFPVLKRQNEGLALGYVTTRLVECGFIFVGVVSLLSVATLRQDLARSRREFGVARPVGTSLVAIHNWTFLLGPTFSRGDGNALLLGYLMYRSGLVPRLIPAIGLVGGADAAVFRDRA